MKQLLRVGFLTLLCVGAVLAVAMTRPTATHAAATSYQLPCSPYPANYYGYGTYVSGSGYHTGEDVCPIAGQPVYAIAEGTVMYSAKTPDSYRWGNLIMIQHTNPDGSQLVSVYGHLSHDRKVVPGQVVAKGQHIGFVGPSWTSDNGNWIAHLHLTLRGGAYGAGVGQYAPNIAGYVGAASGLGSYINPSAYINARLQEPARYDYEVVQYTGNGTRGKNAVYDVTFTLRNTGNATWQAGGANPFRLGTIAPQNRGSGFSAGQGGYGWIYPHRMAIPNDVPPGGTVTINARFNNAQIPEGTYVERFAPVIEGKQWMADKGITIVQTIVPPRYEAQWAGQGAYRNSSPTDTSQPLDTRYLVPGQKINLKAFIRNSGDIAWSAGGSNPVRLGTDRNRDRAAGFTTFDGGTPESERWLSPQRASNIDGRREANGSITPTGTINPGEVAVFSFTATVPNLPAYTYPEYFNLVVEGRGWMNDIGMYYPMRVLPGGYHYEPAGQINPSAFAFVKGSTTAAVDLRNSGTTPWPVNGNVRLATDRTPDRASGFRSNDWVSASRPSSLDLNVSSPGKGEVSPGEVGRFSFALTSQQVTDGTYPEYFRPVVDGVAWMPENYGIYLPVQVSSPENDYQFIDQRFSTSPTNLKVGEEFTATVVARNIGRSSWKTDGANPVRLGTYRPSDRGSGFNVLNGADPWFGPNRASDVDGKVGGVTTQAAVPVAELRQGEIGVFSMPMHTPQVTPGAYNEYFNFVQEGKGWFPDYGIYFPFFVTGF